MPSAIRVIDTHAELASLLADDHTQYILLAGRAGGQTLYGGNAANDDLTLEPTSHGTKTTAYVLLAPTGGRVGIGTTEPSEKLEVADGYIATYQTTAVADSGYPIRFYTNTTGSAKATIGEIRVLQQTANTRDGYFALQLANGGAPSEVLRVTKNGNVGIGTTGPQAKLHIVDSAANQLSIERPSVRRWNVGLDSGGTLQFTDITGGGLIPLSIEPGTATQTLVVRETGNVAVGGYNAGSKLSVTGNLAVGSSYSGTAAPTDGAIIQGNVGIGTTSPIAKLHIENSGAELKNYLVVTDNNAVGYVIRRNQSGGSYNQEWIWRIPESSKDLRLWSTNDWSDLLTIQQGGNVGIGTTGPGSRLDIDAGAFTIAEMTAPTGAANKVRLYAEDNGAGKTRLMAIFGSGVAQQLAIEP